MARRRMTASAAPPVADDDGETGDKPDAAVDGEVAKCGGVTFHLAPRTTLRGEACALAAGIVLPVFDAGERLDQFGAHYFQLAAVMRRQLMEQPRAFGCDAQQNTAGICLVACALQQAFFFRAVRQLNHAVVPQAKALGRVGDGGNCASRRSGDLKQQLMLLWLQAGGVRRLFTELHKGPKAIAKFGQPFYKPGAGRLGEEECPSFINVSYHDILSFACTIRVTSVQKIRRMRMVLETFLRTGRDDRHVVY